MSLSIVQKSWAPRFTFSRFANGDVLEIGAGNQAFPTLVGANVTFAEKPFTRDRDDIFPELIGQPILPPADVLVDLDRDGLQPFRDESFDCVIASHVLEHLAAPIQALKEINRVLRVGGHFVVFLPDRDSTFDKGRDATALQHLVDEYRRSVNTIEMHHLREYLQHLEGTVRPIEDHELEFHRERTFHLHCWNAAEFLAVVIAAESADEGSWQLIDTIVPEDAPEYTEFGFVLRKVAHRSTPFLPETLDIWLRLIRSAPHRHAAHLTMLADAVARDWIALGGDPRYNHDAELARALIGFWLGHLDLRVFEIPVIDMAPMLAWYQANLDTDSRLTGANAETSSETRQT